MEDHWGIVFFSGTGGTRRAAQELKRQMNQQNTEPESLEIGPPVSKEKTGFSEQVNHIVLLFPVHAFDAPRPVYSWIEKSEIQGQHFYVISVSGGGEVWPNTSCRYALCRALRNRGGVVQYEAMLIMPSNWLISMDETFNTQLLRALPGKIKKILIDIQSGRSGLTSRKSGFFQRWISNAEMAGTKQFGHKLKTDSSCNGCGWCSRSCPTENISIVDGFPRFSDACIMCFRCIYGCPQQAIQSRNIMVLKKGYNLEKLEQKMTQQPIGSLEKYPKGRWWKGVTDYLKEGRDRE